MLRPSATAVVALLALCACATGDSVRWDVTIDTMYVLQTAPLSARPLLPAAFAPYRSKQWGWAGGNGYILVARYSNSTTGTPYNELGYLPGFYKPCKGSTKKYQSIQRIWVDEQAPYDAGRNYLGAPKDWAKFEWSSDNSTTSVNVTDAVGNPMFSATFTDVSAVPQVPSWVYDDQWTTTVQWPISKSNRSSAATGDPFLTKLNLVLEFNKIPKLASASRVFVSSKHFTGKSMAVRPIPLGLKVLPDTRGTMTVLTDPVC